MEKEKNRCETLYIFAEKEVFISANRKFRNKQDLDGVSHGPPWEMEQGEKGQEGTPVRDKVATKRNMSPNQGFHCVKKGKRRAGGPKGQDPLKVPSGGLGPVWVCEARKRLQATLVGAKGLEEGKPLRIVGSD